MRTTKRVIAVIGAVASLALGALQLVPAPTRVNPPVNHDLTLQKNRAVPTHVESILRRACMDCHSNETRWPWYSQIAPMSWGVVNDVTRARKAMNLSEWTLGAGRSYGAAIGYLTAMCAGVKGGRMPPAKYRLLHKESRLSASDIESLCVWTAAESDKYRRGALISRAP